jgi:hypothetical protein
MSEASTHIHNQSKTAWQQVNLLMETFNAADNYHLLNSMKEAGRVECLADCPRGDGKPALVIGSGSSLESVLPTISKWKGAVFCSTSHGTVLVKYGCKPTYMTAVDPRTAPDDQDEFGVPFGEWDDTQFVAHVSAPKLFTGFSNLPTHGTRNTCLRCTLGCGFASSPSSTVWPQSYR